MLRAREGIPTKAWHHHRRGDAGRKSMSASSLSNAFGREKITESRPSSRSTRTGGRREHIRALMHSDATTARRTPIRRMPPGVLVTPPPRSSSSLLGGDGRRGTVGGGGHLECGRLLSPPNGALITPPPPPPPLLLEGDEMFVTRAGKSHTVYRLEPQNNDDGAERPPRRDVMLEECYDIERARKRMSLLGPSSFLDTGEYASSSRGPLTDVFTFDLQEINHGVQNGCGTGSMSWDSGIAMGLYFALHPEELRGDVLELGSGVGLGGILSNVASTFIDDDASAVAKKSVTLTDANDDVLRMLRQNIKHAAAFDDGVRVRKLDWFDFLGGGDARESPKDRGQYDTIIASDCAYLRSQIGPLSETISKLLRRDDDDGGDGKRLHMFAPFNRGVAYELIEELHEGRRMRVTVEEVEMSKYRVRLDGGGRVPMLPSKGRYRDADPESLLRRNGTTRGVSKFLHITAWHEARSEIAADARGARDRMDDID